MLTDSGWVMGRREDVGRGRGAGASVYAEHLPSLGGLFLGGKFLPLLGYPHQDLSILTPPI